MKKLGKTKSIILFILLGVFFIAVILLGVNTAQNQSAQDSSASSNQRCIGIFPENNDYCSKFYNTNCGALITIEARDYCCASDMTGSPTSCFNKTWNIGAVKDACSRFYCPGPTTTLQCINSTEMLRFPMCKDNPNYKPGGTVTTPVTPVSPEVPEIPIDNGPSTPSCTPIKPAVAKLTGPRNKTEITESKVSISWEKGGSFGKECRDNGKPNRFILKYAVVGANQNCPVIGSKYKGRQLVEKLPNQKQYSVEIAELKNNKKYCWFIRTKNGETKSETKVRSFVTNIATPAPEVPEEALKITEGGTTIDIVDNAE